MTIVTFGELLLRLTAPRSEPLLQSALLDTCFGGAEANVAVALARLGTPARFVSVVPFNPLAEAGIDQLRGLGVDVSAITHAPGRLGLYFVAPGAGLRASEVVYDRAGSSFAVQTVDAIDWTVALANANRLHISGVTVAVSAAAEAVARAAVERATALDIPVSFDGNFRARLWAARGDDPTPSLDWFLARADLAFVDHRDLAMLAGTIDREAAPQDRAQRTADALFERYPRLRRVAHTSRDARSHEQHRLTGYLIDRAAGLSASRAWVLDAVVDRIGGGDAFAAGLLHSLAQGFGDQRAIEFATATGALKHTLPGDFFRLHAADVDAALGGATDVRR